MKKGRRVFWKVLFVLYILALLYAILWTGLLYRPAGRDFVYHLRNSVNLIPLQTLVEYWRLMSFHLINTDTVVWNIVGNIAMFVPMGFFLPCLFPSARSWKGMLIRQLLIGLALEAAQLLLMTGSLDVDDLILRSAGAAVGFVCYDFYSTLLVRSWRREGEGEESVNWMVRLVLMLFLTSVTGSICMAVWVGAGWLMERAGYRGVGCHMLRVVIPFFLVPMAYWMMRRAGQGSWEEMWYIHTPLILAVCRVLSLVWAAGVAGMTVFYGFCYWKERRERRDLFPCGRQEQACFERVCREMGVPLGRVGLYQTYRTRVPYLRGCLHPEVVLPAEGYSQEQLRVIFCHELTHYRQKDNLTHRLTALVLILHFFNPLAWLLNRLACRWSEYDCDWNACGLSGGARPYFETILAIGEQAGGGRMTSRLPGRRGEMLHRVRHLQASRRKKACSRKVFVLLCIPLLLVSGLSVYGASAGTVWKYREICRKTEEVHKENMAPGPALTEHEGEAEPEARTTQGEVSRVTRRMGAFGWSIGGYVSMETGPIYQPAGVVLHVTALFDDPGGHIKRVGIIEPDGSRRYVEAVNDLSHGFQIRERGEYRIFVENPARTAISVSGSYMRWTEESCRQPDMDAAEFLSGVGRAE